MTFDLVALPHALDLSQRVDTIAPHGSTLADAVRIALPMVSDEERAGARVTIGEHWIPAHLWHSIKPRAGAVVVIRLIPRGGNLRTILQIAVTIAALSASYFLAGPLGPMGAAALGFGISTAGSLLINALVPVRPQDQAVAQTNGSPTYSTSGWQNQLTLDAPVPVVLGQHRIAPPYAARSHTEWDNDRQFIRALFGPVYGPVKIRNIKIGDTILATDSTSGNVGNFKEVALQVREGYENDSDTTLYPEQVVQEDLSVELTAADGPHTRALPRDCTEASVDIAFPQGIVRFDSNGDAQEVSVRVVVRQRAIGANSWTLVDSLLFSDFRQKPLVRTHRWTLPSRGDYEVQLERATIDDPENNETRIIRKTGWSAIRGYRPEFPVAFEVPVALVAVRVRASSQLNGMLETLSYEATSICLDWDHTIDEWVERETRNPAALFRYALQGPMAARPVDDDDIDLDAIVAWHVYCRQNNLTYDRVHDFEASLWDVLTDIAAAGRATPRDNGLQWSVVIDRPQEIVTAHISPRNSWGFSGERSYARLPDAFRIKFLDRDRGYQESERIIPRPGLVGDILVTEALTAPGLTDAEDIWRWGIWRWGELLYRADTYYASQDFEHLTIARGDLAILHHDVLDRAEVTARIINVKEIQVPGPNIWFVELDEPVTMQNGGVYGLRVRHLEGDVSEPYPIESVLHSVVTRPGTGTVIRLAGEQRAPEIGELAFFGPLVSVSREVIVRVIEAAENLTARLTLVDHAPEIEALVDANPAPAFDGRVGDIKGIDQTVPLAPVFDAIEMGEATDEVRVKIKKNPSETVNIQKFILQHRLSGGTYVDVNVSVASGTEILDMYNVADSIQVRAKAVSRAGVTGPTNTAVTYVVGT